MLRAVSTKTEDEAPAEAELLRTAMVATLRESGAIRTDAVARAFGAVPREVFAPEASLETVYDAEAVVRTKFDAHGVCVSSVSAPNAQALMLEMSGIGPGDRVLEYGSGGCNAALIAELVGSGGRVTSVDIDEDVTDRASRCLERAGYSRVRVMLADAEDGAGLDGPYDRIMITFGAWDIPPAWTDQLADGGTLTVPLRMRGLTRVVTFVKHGGCLVSTEHVMFGFLPAQGAGAHPTTQVQLAEGIRLRFDDGEPANPRALARALRFPRAEAWSGATVGSGIPFDLLHLWLVFTLPGIGSVRVSPEIAGREDCPVRTVMGPATVRGGSFAYLTCRRIDQHGKTGNGLWEFGAYGHGPDAAELAAQVVKQIRVWDTFHRAGPPPSIIAVPMPHSPDAREIGTAIEKQHVRIALSSA